MHYCTAGKSYTQSAEYSGKTIKKTIGKCTQFIQFWQRCPDLAPLIRMSVHKYVLCVTVKLAMPLIVR